MGLFGSYTPKKEHTAWYSVRILGEARSLIATKGVRIDYERELAERLNPYQNMLHHVEMAYEINAYSWNGPKSREFIEKKYGATTREKILDAHLNPGVDTALYPHRGPIQLDLAGRKLLTSITKDRGLPFYNDKSTYRYTDVNRDARLREALNKITSDALRKHSDNPFKDVYFVTAPGAYSWVPIPKTTKLIPNLIVWDPSNCPDFTSRFPKRFANK